jgi:hypothetical protein
MTPSRIALTAAAAIAALYGAGLYYEQALAGPHCCGLTWPTPDPAQAERLMAKDDPKGANPAIQRRAALAVLAARPMESSAWLRLAYADRLQHGRLTDEGRHAVEMSYLVLPYAGPGTPWRLQFVLDDWTGVSGQIRQDAMREMQIVKRDAYPLRLATYKAIGKVRNASGQLSAALQGMTLQGLWPSENERIFASAALN